MNLVQLQTTDKEAELAGLPRRLFECCARIVSVPEVIIAVDWEIEVIAWPFIMLTSRLQCSPMENGSLLSLNATRNPKARAVSTVNTDENPVESIDKNSQETKKRNGILN
jgi:hypothetical protein